MNIILKNKVRWFLRYADSGAKAIVEALLKEIENVEKDRQKDKIRYEQKVRELENDMYYWQDKFYGLFYRDE